MIRYVFSFFCILLLTNNFVLAQGSFFGATHVGGYGGGYGQGTIFEYIEGTNTITKRVQFDDNDTLHKGNDPVGRPIVYNGKLYGMTYGLNTTAGTIYEYNPVNQVFTPLYSFNGAAGYRPKGSLVVVGTKLYGITSNGGPSNGGTIFEFDPSNKQYTDLFDFSSATGTFSSGGLIAIGSVLYGTSTSLGGGTNVGTLFSYDISSGTFTKLVTFGGSLGGSPQGSLTLYNNKLYGTTNYGGANNGGTLYEYDIVTTTIVTRVDFDANTGENATQGCTVFGTKLYGMLSGGGDSVRGTIYEYDPATYIFTKKIDLYDSIGSDPLGNLEVAGNLLYGMTQYGGTYNNGVLFQYDPVSNTYAKKIDFQLSSNNTGANPTGSLLFYDLGNSQTIKSWTNMTNAYGDTPFAPLAFTTSGLSLSYTSSDPTVANIVGGKITIYKPGITMITASQAGNFMYDKIPDTTIQLTVTKRMLTAKPNDVQRCPSDPNPTFTITYTGFAAPDDASVLDVLPTASTTAGTTAGTYPITISGGADNNYQFNLVNGEITVAGIGVPSEIIGKDVLSVESEALYTVDPVLSSYTYQWFYTGTDLRILGDSLATPYDVYATSNATSGTVSCVIVRCGISDTLTKAITITKSPTFANFLTPPTCQIYSSDCDSSYISYLKIENMFQTPVTECSPSGYSDYTDSDFTGTLYLGEAYTINLNGGGLPGYFGLWIDYNNDGSFGGPEEMLSANFDAGFQYVVPNIIIPNIESYKGPRRMRIRTRLSKPFTSGESCQLPNEKGETEDYLIYLDIRPTLEGPNFISPNNDGLNDLFVMRGVNSKMNNSLIIIDRMGKLVYQTDNYKNDWPNAEETKALKDDGYFYIFKNGDNEVKSYLEITK